MPFAFWQQVQFCFPTHPLPCHTHWWWCVGVQNLGYAEWRLSAVTMLAAACFRTRGLLHSPISVKRAANYLLSLGLGTLLVCSCLAGSVKTIILMSSLFCVLPVGVCASCLCGCHFLLPPRPLQGRRAQPGPADTCCGN